MRNSDVRGDLERAIAEGRAAMQAGDWDAAFAAFERAAAAPGGDESADAAEGLGMAAWWLDAAEVMFDARERAFLLLRQRRDDRGAGRLAMMLGVDSFYFRGETAVARGWLARADTLLANVTPVAAEHAWLKLWQADVMLELGESATAARALAAEAAAIARQLDLVDLEMPALAIEGLACVLGGDPAAGIPRLDEAATSALSGELRDPFSVGLACCFVVMACDRVRDFGRGAQWCRRLRDFCEKMRFNAMLAICRTQYAGVLISSGAWAEAETELEGAIKQLADTRPAIEPEAVLRLAELRRRQGRFDEADTLLAAIEEHPRSLLVRAELALDRGDTGAAAALADRFARGIDASHALDVFFVTELLVRARAASPEASCDELDELVRRLVAFSARTKMDPLRAAARHCEGLAAARRGAHLEARRAFEDAADVFARTKMPYERARSRIELARVLVALDDRSAAEAEARAAEHALVELGASHAAGVARTLFGERGPEPVVRSARHAGSRTTGNGASTSGLTPRELEVIALVAQGLSNGEIGRKLFVSEFTVKRHVGNILTKLSLPSRAAAAAYATQHRLV